MFGRKTKALASDFLEMQLVDSGVAVLEPEPTPEVPAIAVMERAKAVISPFEVEGDLGELDNTISRLMREKNRLLGVEAHARQAVDTKIYDLSSQRRKLNAYIKFNGEKLRLDSEVLTWRKKDVLFSSRGGYVLQPEVGLFGLDKHDLTLSSQWSTHGEWSPELPVGLTKLYEDVYGQLGTLNSQSGYRMTHCITAAFSGVIPAETKEKIREAQESRVFSDIRLLAETDWHLDVHPNPHYADPIVIGLVDCEMWVIDMFDPTPLEDYIAAEFTS